MSNGQERSGDGSETIIWPVLSIDWPLLKSGPFGAAYFWWVKCAEVAKRTFRSKPSLGKSNCACAELKGWLQLVRRGSAREKPL